MLAATPLASACDEGYLEETDPTSTSAERGTVLVIGAGMAGLTAARDLRARGFAVIVIEGRQRLGGRIRTDRSLGVPLDLGASWIHGMDENPILALADELDVDHVETDYDDLALYDSSGARVGDAELEEVGSGVEELLGEVEAIGERAEEDMSTRAAIDRALRGEELSPRERELLEWRLSTIEVTAAEDLSRLSLVGDESESFDGDDHLFPGGYHPLIEAVAEGTTVHLGQVVTRVEHGARGVTVRTRSGLTYEGDAALITVPLGVLKAGRIQFVPPLPARKRQAIRGLGVGVLNKVAVKFDRVFWPDDVQFLCFASRAPREFPVVMNVAHYTDEPILMAFTGGSFARSIEALPDREVVRRLMDKLRGAFGPAALEPVASVMTRWQWNPMAHGSYAYIPVGGTNAAMSAIGDPVDDRLFFAGDSTEPNHGGNVHGAFLSGRREAGRIASAIAGARARRTNPSPEGIAASSPHGLAYPRALEGEGCRTCHRR